MPFDKVCFLGIFVCLTFFFSSCNMAKSLQAVALELPKTMANSCSIKSVVLDVFLADICMWTRDTWID